MNETCRTCSHWRESHKGLGECHKKSPGIATDGTDMAVWPNTHDWEDCGDYKPKLIAEKSLLKWTDAGGVITDD